MPPKSSIRHSSSSNQAQNDNTGAGRDMNSIMQDMANDTNLRKQDRQRRLQTTFEQEANDIEQEIQNVIQHAATESDTLNNAHLNTLSQLLERKSHLESEIFAHTQKLVTAHERTKAELLAVLEGQKGDCDEALGLLENLSQTNRNGDNGGDGDGNGEVGDNKKGKGKGKEKEQKRKARDVSGLVDEVPTEDQIKRAEDMARRGMRI